LPPDRIAAPVHEPLLVPRGDARSRKCRHHQQKIYSAPHHVQSSRLKVQGLASNSLEHVSWVATRSAFPIIPTGKALASAMIGSSTCHSSSVSSNFVGTPEVRGIHSSLPFLR